MRDLVLDVALAALALLALLGLLLCLGGLAADAFGLGGDCFAPAEMSL